MLKVVLWSVKLIVLTLDINKLNFIATVFVFLSPIKRTSGGEHRKSFRETEAADVKKPSLLSAVAVASTHTVALVCYLYGGSFLR